MASRKRTPELWLTQSQAELYEGTEYLALPAAALLLDAAQPAPSTSRIKALDLGCGVGPVGSQLVIHPHYKGAELLSIDVDESMVEAVKAKGLKAERMDILTMPYEYEYTHVFANGVISALADPQDGLARAVKALVPGGTLAFTTGAKSGPFELLQEAFSHFPIPPLPDIPPTWSEKSYVLEQLMKVPVEDVKAEKRSFKHNTVNRSVPDLAWDMRAVVAMIVGHLPPEQKEKYGWAVFSKIEEVLRRWESEGRELESDVWVFTARKKAD